MSLVAETGDGGSVSSLSDTAQEAPSPRTSNHQDGDLGEGSESESYVEVEQLGDDSVPGPANFTTVAAVTSPAQSTPCNVVRHITKRTLITLHQRSILEEYYRNGMTSASQQLMEVHEVAAEKTGLDLTVVRNWIRNRRRPNAAKMAEKMAEKIAAYGIPVTNSISLPTTQVPTLIPSSLTPLTTLPHTVVVTATNHHHMTPGLIRVAEANGVSPLHYSSIPHISSHAAPEPKRFCLEPTVSLNSQSHSIQQSPSPSSMHLSLLVKVRVCGSGESDFVEVEVGPVTYPSLLAACCEELEVASTDVVKIRKLPNVLIRKDRDVQRMKDGQELEVVLSETTPTSATIASAVSPPATYPMTSMLTVNPFSSNTVLALPNHGVVQQRNDGIVTLKPDENGTGNHIPGLTTDSPSQHSELHNHSHSAGAVNGLQ